MSSIHKTAIIEEGAQIGKDVSIGAYAFIGSKVVLGDGCEIRHHATVEGKTVMGKNNCVHPYALIGALTQDLKYDGGEPGVVIGDNNDFREYCTVHTATFDGDNTIIGSNNHFLAYTHVAHECIVGNYNILSNNATLGGHVVIQDRIVMGGFAAIHQFCNIGSYCMLSAFSKITQDVPPYVIVDGNPAEFRTINKVGLERNGLKHKQISEIRDVYKTLYKSGLTKQEALTKILEETCKENESTQYILSFIEKSERGIC